MKCARPCRERAPAPVVGDFKTRTRRARTPGTGTLDHVIPRGLVPVDARVREAGGSDHFPLRVVLQRRS